VKRGRVDPVLMMFSALACETITIFGIGSNKAMDVINSSFDLAGNTVTIQADGKSDFLLGDFMQDMPSYGRGPRWRAYDRGYCVVEIRVSRSSSSQNRLPLLQSNRPRAMLAP
jgi:hypothetical protein